MTFEDTMIYLVLATAQYVFLILWEFHHELYHNFHPDVSDSVFCNPWGHPSWNQPAVLPDQRVFGAHHQLFGGFLCRHDLPLHPIHMGINIMKKVVVSLLSGAAIPISFFPESLAKVVMVLPFQAIYNTPLSILIHYRMPMGERFEMLGLQLFWVIVMSVITDLFWKRSEDSDKILGFFPQLLLVRRKPELAILPAWLAVWPERRVFDVAFHMLRPFKRVLNRLICPYHLFKLAVLQKDFSVSDL